MGDLPSPMGMDSPSRHLIRTSRVWVTRMTMHLFLFVRLSVGLELLKRCDLLKFMSTFPGMHVAATDAGFSLGDF